MERSRVLATYLAYDGLVWHQWEGRHLVLLKPVTAVKEDASGVRLEWVGA
jgi:hypothetical protein